MLRRARIVIVVQTSLYTLEKAADGGEDWASCVWSTDSFGLLAGGWFRASRGRILFKVRYTQLPAFPLSPVQMVAFLYMLVSLLEYPNRMDNYWCPGCRFILGELS